MSHSNIVLGLIIMAIGMYGIAFNKYPGKQISYDAAKKNYKTANERRITLFDGIFCIIFGVVYMIPGMVVLFPLALLLIGYYPIKVTLLKHKLI
ncbi:hypothetical protein [Desulfosporosinus sp. BICA1-9]|uniref:hypothetical protein n=1 Tax=Desulfosporosinus sp. BICA1-9 TaxID=1531958 RepID=UPI00054B3685|nr:hypothetical protein [Desulfosporosinus sp. BICA1-9]KJS46300.1 MAG: hypothetical protein VR66_26170 [Peptococcaceae bacterium BRH_c23]KJS89114.1 MAG: hypothetical protein JL57_09225 [Desulfosporosinus sp. BICA1-9]HBW35268.1 hypothetical protein [Desulfosporosinus sp.]